MVGRIKIIFFIDSFRVGGMHRQVYLILNSLDTERFEPILVSQSQEGGFKELFLSLGCKIYTLKWVNRFSFISVLIRLIKILRIEKVDYIFITQLPNFIYYVIGSFFLSTNPKLIGSFRALNFWLGNKSKWHLFVETFFVKFFYKKCHLITANSKALVNHYNKIINVSISKPILCIYNGIDFCFNAIKFSRQLFYNACENDTLIIMAARFDLIKDFETFLNAAYLVSKKIDTVKFYLIGDGDLKGFIENKILDLDLSDKVFLIGEVSNPSDYIRNADISVLSTFGEGLSNTLLESMLLKVPCIATSVGGNVELLSEERGLLVPCKDSVALSLSIIRLISNKQLRETYINNSYSYVTNTFDVNRMVKSYESFILNDYILNNKKVGR